MIVDGKLSKAYNLDGSKAETGLAREAPEKMQPDRSRATVRPAIPRSADEMLKTLLEEHERKQASGRAGEDVRM